MHPGRMKATADGATPLEAGRTAMVGVILLGVGRTKGTADGAILPVAGRIAVVGATLPGTGKTAAVGATPLLAESKNRF